MSIFAFIHRKRRRRGFTLAALLWALAARVLAPLLLAHHALAACGLVADLALWGGRAIAWGILAAGWALGKGFWPGAFPGWPS